MKIVLDSNVLMSAFGTHGLCENLVLTCLDRHEVYTSEHILKEVATRMGEQFRMPKERVAQVVAFLRDELEVVEPAPVAPAECRDPKDLAVLGTAEGAGAEVLVTGDKDLLVLRRFGKTEIVSPREFYGRMVG